MAVNAVTSNAPAVQATPPRQPEPAKPAEKTAERVAPPPLPPPQPAAPTVNTSGQKIGTTISTSA